MSIRQTFLAIDGRVSRMIRRHRFGRGLAAFGMTVAAVVFGTVASATPILSFPSVQVTADGINPTPVTVLVGVNNTGSAIDVDTLGATYEVTEVSPLLGDLSFVSGSVTGVFVNGAPLLSGYTAPGPNPAISIDTNATTSQMAPGFSNLMSLNFQVPAGVLSGTYVIDFLTGVSNPNRQFSNTTPSATIPYGNGNNGTTLGVITVVPEASSSVILASGALLATGVGFAQRRARRTTRKVEIAG